MYIADIMTAYTHTHTHTAEEEEDQIVELMSGNKSPISHVTWVVLEPHLLAPEQQVRHYDGTCHDCKSAPMTIIILSPTCTCINLLSSRSLISAVLCTVHVDIHAPGQLSWLSRIQAYQLTSGSFMMYYSKY